MDPPYATTELVRWSIISKALTFLLTHMGKAVDIQKERMKRARFTN